MDWMGFLDANGINWVSSGPNTKRGNISIKCPFCTDDPSEHMSIALEEDAFGCWRNRQHSGRKPYSLVAALLQCSFSQARLVVEQFSAPDPTNLDDAIKALGEAQMPAERPERPIALPRHFQPIKPTGLTKRFWRYLADRGFDDVQALIDRYGLRCCQSGRWNNRIIIPVWDQQGFVGWTARAIGKTISAPRYLTSSEQVKETVFLENKLFFGGKVLFITEGPFDALKLDFYGYKHDCRACALFGINPVIEQIATLHQLIKRFNKTIILFDKNTHEQTINLAGQLPPSVKFMNLSVAKDPGELTKQQIDKICPYL